MASLVSSLRLSRLVLAVALLALVILVGFGGAGLTSASSFNIAKIGEYRTGTFDEGGAEIVAYDPASKRLFSVNAAEVTVDILDMSDPTNPTEVAQIDATAYGATANSVSVWKGIVAVAIEADPKTDPGKVVLFDVDGTFLNEFTVGALPDMVTFTKGGRYLVVANEGEPNDDYSIDPEGSVSVIRVRRPVTEMTQDDVRTATFTKFNNQPLDPSIRVFGPNATVAQDMEPEYIATSDNQRLAFVTLQENNAVAVVNLNQAEVTKLMGLGFKDHNQPGNGLDASDRDGVINIANWPIFGVYMPDTIQYFRGRGGEFLITANEGDARDYDTFGEESRVKDLTLDATAFPNAAALQADAAIGRLNVTTTLGDTDNDDEYEALYAFGARSFSIWNMRGQLIFDSGSELEEVTAAAHPADFNSDNTENDTFDNRSDNKGPEPEVVATGQVGSRIYAFVGLERIGGVAVYDVTVPRNATFVTYVTSRDFAGDPETDTAGDLGPEGMVFIPKGQSPTGNPLLVVGNEISGSVAVFEITR